MSLEKALFDFEDIPVNPDMWRKLQKIFSDANADLNDLNDVLKVDGSLTVKLISISNSPFFNTGVAIIKLEDAISRLGMRQVYELVNYEFSKKLLEKKLVAYDICPEAMWVESMSCAYLMDSFSKSINQFQEVSYMVGLLHSIGKILVNQYAENEVGIEDLKCHPIKSYLDEERLFGFNYAQAGGAILDKWNFPKEISDPISHQLDTSGPDQNKFLGLFKIALSASPKLLTESPDEPFVWDGELKSFMALGYSKNQFQSALKSAQEGFREAQKKIQV